MRLEKVVEGCPETVLLYWTDCYARAFDASLARAARDRRRDVYVVLDRTAFHPKGGGQPSDRGVLSGSGWKFGVKKAMLFKGRVIHFGRLREGEVIEGPVFGELDWGWRYLTMKRHTAGHLLDHCLAETTGKRVETTESWLGDPCYVGYKGKEPLGGQMRKAEELANKMISRGGSVSLEEISYEELLRRAPDAPNIYRLPQLKSVRAVTIEGCSPIPCGGTHVKDIAEIGRLSVKEAVQGEGSFNVYYDVG